MCIDPAEMLSFVMYDITIFVWQPFQENWIMCIIVFFEYCVPYS